MLERGDLSSEQAQTNAQLGAAGAFTGFLASLGLAAVPALETGVAMGLQRGLMSNQGSMRMLARVAAVAAGGARACSDPGGGGSGSGQPTFQIMDGVRRAKAAQLAGSSSIRAEVLGSGGKVVDIPLEALLSPKTSIDTSGAGLSRWLTTLQQTLAGSPPPPILVQPGGQGTPLTQVVIQ